MQFTGFQRAKITRATAIRPWPDDIPRDGAMVSVEAYVPTRQGYARLSAEQMPINAGPDES